MEEKKLTSKEILPESDREEIRESADLITPKEAHKIILAVEAAEREVEETKLHAKYFAELYANEIQLKNAEIEELKRLFGAYVNHVEAIEGTTFLDRSPMGEDGLAATDVLQITALFRLK